jgi:integrase
MKGADPLTERQFRAMLRTMRGPGRARDRALLVLGCRTGFRVSPLLALTIGDVARGRRIVDRLYVPRRLRKGKLAGRSVPLSRQAKEVVRELLRVLRARGAAEPSDPLFASRRDPLKAIDRTQAWRVLRASAAAAGVTARVGTHSMRKTFAARLQERWGNDLMRLQEALGHARIDSTARYLGINRAEIEKAIIDMGR